MESALCRASAHCTKHFCLLDVSHVFTTTQAYLVVVSHVFNNMTQSSESAESSTTTCLPLCTPRSSATLTLVTTAEPCRVQLYPPLAVCFRALRSTVLHTARQSTFDLQLPTHQQVSAAAILGDMTPLHPSMTKKGPSAISYGSLAVPLREVKHSITCDTAFCSWHTSERQHTLYTPSSPTRKHSQPTLLPVGGCPPFPLLGPVPLC